MSVCFTLTGNKLSLDAWNRLLEEWAERRPEPLYDDPIFQGEKSPAAHVWGPGSIRGAVFYFEGEKREVELRLSALASRTDWKMGFEIARLALRQGGGTLTRETDEKYGFEMLSPARAEKEAVKDFCFSVRAMAGSFSKRGTKKAGLPMGLFNMPVTAEDFPECTPENIDEVEGRLVDRVARYGTTFKPRIMQMKDGTRVSVWPLSPTLVTDVDLLAVPASGAGDADLLDVPFARVRELLGARAEALGGCTYLPGLDEGEDRKLLAAIRAAASAKGGGADAGAAGAGGGPADPRMKIVRLVVKKLVATMLAGGSPEDVKKKMVAGGLDADMVDSLISLTAMIVRGLVEEKKSPEDVAAELTKQGMPEDVVATAILAIAEAFAERSKG